MEINFTIDALMPQDHPYRHLILKHADRFATIFQVLPTDILKEPDVPFPLKIYGRQKLQGLGAIFLYFFQLPVSAQEYLEIMRDFSFQKKVDPNIDEFKTHKDISIKDTEVLYIAYKRVLIIMPRYFIYVRYTIRVNDQIWVIAVSDPDSEIIKQKTKGEIVLTFTRIKNNEGGCEVSVYSNIDMKMKVKLQMAINTGSLELAKYLKNIYNAVKK